MKNQDNKLFKRIEKDLKQLRFSQVEAGFNHLSYSEELNLYQYVKNGDMKAVKHSAEMFAGDRVGKLSDDPIRNGQYMFVASITTACRFCIEGGMDPQESYGLSDIYIHAVDKCRTIDEIKDLHKDMITDYTRRMSRLKHSITYSPQIAYCIDYISKHIHDRLTVKQLAEELELADSYLSTLFIKEVGIPVSEYIRRSKIDVAKGLLEYFNYSCTDIALYLGFSNESHFSSVFKKYEGITPRQYRSISYHNHFTGQAGTPLTGGAATELPEENNK